MLRRCVEDLSNTPGRKMGKWVQENVRDRVNTIKVNNLTMHEISVHRPTLTRVLDNLYNIHVAPDTRGLSSTDSTKPSSHTTGASGARPAQGRQLRRVIRKTKATFLPCAPQIHLLTGYVRTYADTCTTPTLTLGMTNMQFSTFISAMILT